MKKIAMFLAMATLLVFPLAGCGGKKTLKVGATPAPHAEILQSIQEEMANRGVEMEIVEFTDYPLINQALANGDIDANYFQHEPYLVDFNEKNGTDLKTAAYIHYEPLALFPGKTKAIADLKEGAQIGVPNDATNEARALLLLQDQGLIKLRPERNQAGHCGKPEEFGDHGDRCGAAGAFFAGSGHGGDQWQLCLAGRPERQNRWLGDGNGGFLGRQNVCQHRSRAQRG